MIEVVDDSNLSEVLPLIRQYQTFYQVPDISDERNQTFFAQFGPDSEAGCLFLYRHEGKAVAFSTVYFSFSSTIASKVAILNDMYTSPAARGLGLARQLVEHCRQFALAKGACRLQWVTARDNAAAQKLYDGLPTTKSTWYFYTHNN